MAASTSLILSQATLSCSTVPRNGSSTNATQQPNSLSTLFIPTFSGLKSTPAFSPRASTRRHISATRRRVISNAAVETLEKTDTSLIRFLAIDSEEKANSGHPGLPMGCAPMGHILYDEVMSHEV